MVDRIASHAQSLTLASELMRLQSSYAKGQLQASSGLKSDNYQGIANSTQRLLSLESDYSHVTAQSENAQIALDRVNGMYAAVQNMIDMVTSAQTMLSGAISGGGLGQENLETEAEQSRDSFVSSLNTQQAGRYLFGGGVTDTAPVDIDDVDYTVALPPSTVDTAYYQGNGYIAKVQASDNLSVAYGITADNSAFEKVLRAYNLMANNASDDIALQEAYELLQEGFDGLNNMQTTLSNQAAALDDQINRNADDLNLLDNLIGDIKSVDLAEITVKLATLETQLEASYSLTTKLLKLNLHDYL
jgi:flagellar hook-associated protein 3 FlgL